MGTRGAMADGKETVLASKSKKLKIFRRTVRLASQQLRSVSEKTKTSPNNNTRHSYLLQSIQFKRRAFK